MTTQTAPTAASDLFAESYKLSPKQREVLDALQTFPDGARAIDVAKKLDLHVNTARGHLEELVAKEAIRVVTAAAKVADAPPHLPNTRPRQPRCRQRIHHPDRTHGQHARRCRR